MPMYFPDLESVRDLANRMAKHKDDKKYTGIIPKTEEELPEARKQLGKYMRDIWGDTVFALEIELALSKENYYEKISEYMKKRFAKGKSA